MDFKVGDVVVLKSGGSKMTIKKIEHVNSNNANTVLQCVWFDNLQGDERLTDGKFIPEMLMYPN